MSRVGACEHHPIHRFLQPRRESSSLHTRRSANHVRLPSGVGGVVVFNGCVAQPMEVLLFAAAGQTY